MQTPRHQVDVSSSNPELLAEIDALYEICDAEFSSDERILKYFDGAMKSNKKDKVDVVSKTLFIHVVKSSEANELLVGVTKISLRNISIAVSKTLAEDWVKQHEKERYLTNKKESEDSGPTL